MAFQVDIQSAPIRQGTIGTPSAWVAGPGPTVTASGTYDGATSKTYTFQCNGAVGTVDSTAKIELTWSDGEGNSGTLQLGTDHGYSANDEVYIDDGLFMAFDSDAAFVLGHNFTVAVTASNRIPGTPIVVSGDADPADNRLASYERGDMDVVNRTFDGREFRVQRSTTGTVSILTDYLDDVNRDKLLHFHSSRSAVCVGENFNENTVFLMHGGGLSPFIGDRSSFSRSGNATYPDPRTGLLRSVDTDEARIVGGKAGRAIMLESATTNIVDTTADETPSNIWNINGGSTGTTLSYDTTVFGPFDPADDYWNDAQRKGCAKVYFDGGMTPGTDGINTDDYVIAAVSKWWTASIYVRGRGVVNVRLRTGAGAASNVIASEAGIQLTDDWYRVEISGSSGGTHTRADIWIEGEERGFLHVWGPQIEQQPLASEFVQTSGGGGTRALDSQTFTHAIPPAEGTLSFWMFWKGRSSTTTDTFTVLDSTGVSGAEKFGFSYTDGAPGSCIFAWYLSTTVTAFLPVQSPLTAGTWYHWAVTWAEGTNDGTVDCIVYRNGVPFITALNNANWQPFFGTGFTMGVGSAIEQDINGLRIEELRIDTAAMTAAEVLQLYNRLTDDEWLHIHRAHAGRKYRITNMRERWMHPSQPDKIIMELELTEVDRDDDSVVVPA